jgi:hypothetical protein
MHDVKRHLYIASFYLFEIMSHDMTEEEKKITRRVKLFIFPFFSNCNLT